MSHLNNTNDNSPKISVILPCLNDGHSLKSQLNAINSQLLLPYEVLVIDSSSDDIISDFCKTVKFDFHLRYIRVGRAYKFDKYLESLIKIAPFLKKKFPLQGKLYPSEASNFGAEESLGDVIAFLDMSTLPKKNWLLDYSKLLSSNDIIFGVTEYQSNTKIQKFIHYSTFGKRPHETNPGTLVKRDLYLQNKMLEGYRSGVDIEWRDRIKSLFNKWVTPSQIYLSYNALPKSLYKFLWKMFVYQLHSVPLKIQQNTKAAVGIIVLLMLSLILSRWNYLVGWESPLYLPHVTKITLMTFNLFFVFIIILRRISSKALIGLSEPVIKKILIWLVVSSILFISYKWNAVVAGWMESSRFYIPHLTKTMILLLFLGLLFYRGIFFPLKNGVNKNNVFPLYFFGIGFVGAIGDLAKIPGFLLGAISYTFLGLKK